MANATANLTQGIVGNITPIELPLMDKMLIGNTVREIIFAALLLIGLVAAMKIFSYLTIVILEHIDRKHPTQAKEIVVKMLKALQLPLFIIVGLKIVSTTIMLPEVALTVLDYLSLVVITFYSVKVINAIIRQVSKKVIEKRAKEDADTDTNLMNFFTKTLFGLVWIAGLLFLLNQFGVNVSKVFTGLGIAGIAIAFALQNVLGDIFASVSIYFDKPFKPGDYVVFDGEEGNIIKTGIKSTRIKLLRGEELVVSNKYLTESKLKNVNRMEKRRVDIDLQVKYGTPKAKLEKLPGQLEAIIKKYKKNVEFARSHLKQLNPSNIEFETIYYVNKSDYTLFMDLQQKIILDIIELFENEGIEFAFPTQSIILQGEKSAQKAAARIREVQIKEETEN